MGGGGKGSTQTSQVTIPPEVLAQYQSVNAEAQAAGSAPFQNYTGTFVAPVNAEQNAGIAGTNAAASAAQPYYGAATSALGNAQAATTPYYGAATSAATGAAQTGAAYGQAATGLAAAGAQSVNPTAVNSSSIDQYMSPYLKDVAGTTEALNNQQYQQAQSGQMGTAISSGAFGGDRSGIAAANLQQQQSLANNSEISGIMNTGYNNALNTAQQQQGVGLAAGQANRAAVQNAEQQVQSLGQQAYTQGQGTSAALAGLGQDVYGTGAATSAGLANLGTASQTAGLQGAQAQLAAGQVQQSTDQAANTANYNQFLQAQSYPFQVAQFEANVAEGTGSLSGSTTTNNSVSNGIFARGGAANENNPRDHFAGGGVAGGFDPAALGQMASDYQAMYGNLLSAHGGVSGGSIVPAPSGAPAQLHPSQIAPPQQQSAANTVNGVAGAADSVGKLGGSTGLWKYGNTQGPAPKPLAMGVSDYAPDTTTDTTTDTNFDAGSADPSDAVADTTSDVGDDMSFAKGGRLGRDDGGAIPYDNGTGVTIPDDPNTTKLLTPAAPASSGSGGSSFMGDVKTAASIAAMFAARGGRAKFASGGAPDDAIANAIQTATSPFGKYGNLEGVMAAQQAASDGLLPAASAAANDDTQDSSSAAAPVVPGPASNPSGINSQAARGVPAQLAKGSGTGSRANRNNNPGNIESGKFTKGLPGYTGSDGRFAIFDTPEAGRNAQISLLGSYLDKGIDTPLKIANKWAPASDPGNDPTKYAATIAARLGIKPTGTVTAGMLPVLAAAQATNEGWKTPKARKAGGRAGFADGGSPDDSALDAESDATLGTPPPTDLLAGTPNDTGATPTSDTTFASPVAAEEDSPKPSKDSFLKGIGRGEASSIIPLLAGLGALATTQTNNPFTAMAAGLGAGAQSYQGQRQFGLDQQFVDNNTKTAQADVGAKNASTLGLLQDSWGKAIGNAAAEEKVLAQSSTMERTGLIPTGTTARLRLQSSVVPASAVTPTMGSYAPPPMAGVAGPSAAPAAPTAPTGVAPPAAPAADGSTTPLGQTYPSLNAPLKPFDLHTPGGQQNTGVALAMSGLPGAETLTGLSNGAVSSGKYLDGKGVVQNTPGAIPAALHQQVAGDIATANVAEKARVNEAAKAAQTTLNNAGQLRTMLVGGAPGTYAVLGGPLEKYRQGAGATLMSMGVSPDAAGWISGTDVTSSLAADKLRAYLASAAATGSLGSSVGNHPGEFRTFLNSTPGTQLPTAVSAWLIDHNTVPQARNAQARADYVNGLDPAKDDFVASGNAWQKSNPWDPTLRASNAKPKPGAPKAAAPSYPAGTPSASDAHGRKRYYVNGAWTK